MKDLLEQVVTLRQRVMHDVSAVSLKTQMFGRNVSMPVALAPVGLSGLYARRGEVQAAKAAENLIWQWRVVRILLACLRRWLVCRLG